MLWLVTHVWCVCLQEIKTNKKGNDLSTSNLKNTDTKAAAPWEHLWLQQCIKMVPLQSKENFSNWRTILNWKLFCGVVFAFFSNLTTNSYLLVIIILTVQPQHITSPHPLEVSNRSNIEHVTTHIFNLCCYNGTGGRILIFTCWECKILNLLVLGERGPDFISGCRVYQGIENLKIPQHYRAK